MSDDFFAFVRPEELAEIRAASLRVTENVQKLLSDVAILKFWEMTVERRMVMKEEQKLLPAQPTGEVG